MEAKLIAVIDYCTASKIDVAFIHLLKGEDLIEVHLVLGEEFIAIDQLPMVEQYARWYFEMEINVAGIDALQHLLLKVKNLQGLVNELETKLKLYE